MEKAFAKFCKNYGSLEHGDISWAWQALTGCEKQHCYKRDAGGLWAHLWILVEEQRKKVKGGERRACPFYRSGWALNIDQLWTEVHKGNADNFLMGAHIQNTREVEREDGLVEGHAYSLVSAVESHGYRLVKLRNPWGRLEWLGAWSDGDSMWEEHPEVAEDLRPDGLGDGCFWMEFSDVAAHFTCISISPNRMQTQRSPGQVPVSRVKMESPRNSRGVDLYNGSLTSSQPKSRKEPRDLPAECTGVAGGRAGRDRRAGPPDCVVM